MGPLVSKGFDYKAGEVLKVTQGCLIIIKRILHHHLEKSIIKSSKDWKQVGMIDLYDIYSVKKKSYLWFPW